MNFIVMEKLGNNLMEYLEMFESNIMIKTIVHMAIQILKRLSEVHQTGFIYGNMRPSNIIIGRRKLIYNKQEGNLSQFNIQKCY